MAPNIAVMATKIERIPKSSGEYNLVSMGLIRIGIAWANEVPVIRIKTFFKNSELSI
jgi:hypothetical protein